MEWKSDTWKEKEGIEEGRKDGRKVKEWRSDTWKEKEEIEVGRKDGRKAKEWRSDTWKEKEEIEGGKDGEKRTRGELEMAERGRRRKTTGSEAGLGKQQSNGSN